MNSQTTPLSPRTESTYSPENFSRCGVGQRGHALAAPRRRAAELEGLLLGFWGPLTWLQRFLAIAAFMVLGTSMAAGQTAIVSGQVVNYGSLLTNATGVAVDSAQNAYVATSSGAVYKETYVPATNSYTEQLLFTTAAGSASGIAVLPTGTGIYVGTGTGLSVVGYTGSGTTYTTSGTAFTGFLGNTYPGVDSAGNVYILDSLAAKVYKEPLSGGTFSAQAQIGTGFTLPTALTVTTNGIVYVSDTGASTVSVLTGTGTSYVKTALTFTGQTLTAQRGIQIDSAGNLYIENNTALLKAVVTSGTTYAASVLLGNTGATSLGIDTAGDLYLQAPTSAAGSKLIPYANLGYVNFGTVTPATPVTAQVAFTVTTAGTLGNSAVVTQGLTGYDFQPATAGGTCTGLVATVNSVCTVNVTFTPKGAGLRLGAASVTSTTGATLVSANLAGIGNAPLALLQTPVLGATLSTTLSVPRGMTTDPAGNLYVANVNAGNLLKFAPGSTTAVVVMNQATTGVNCSVTSVAIDGQGNIFVGCGNAATFLELVGGSTSQVVQFSAGPVAPAPWLAVDAAGNLYFSPAYTGYSIYKIDSNTHALTALVAIPAGSRYAGGLRDANGNIFVAEINNGGLFELASGSSTLVNINNSSLTVLGQSLAQDPAGNLYLAVITNGGGSGSNSLLRFPAGNYSAAPQVLSGFLGGDGLAIDSKGLIYSSYNNTTLVVYNRAVSSLTFGSTAVGTASSTQSMGLENDGTAPLTFSPPSTGFNPSTSTNFTFSTSSTCPLLSTLSSSLTLAAGSSCNEVVTFTPQVIGAVSGSLIQTDNSSNSPGSTQIINLAGTGTIGTATITVPNVSAPVTTTPTLTATVVGGTSGPAPAGTVTFKVGTGAVVTASAAQCTSNTSSETCSVPYPAAASLAAGTYTITAAFSADPNYTAISNTGTLTLTTTTTTLTSSNPNPSVAGNSVSFTATVAPFTGTGTPTGSVNFTSDGIALGSGTLNASGVATYATAALTAGVHTIVATYVPTGTVFTASTSANYSQTVQFAATSTDTGAGSNFLGSTPTTVTVVIPYSGATSPTGNITVTDATHSDTSGPIAASVCTTLTAPARLSCPIPLPTANVPAGSFSLTIAQAADAFYAGSTGTGTLTISAAGSGIIVSGAVVSYGSTLQTAVGTAADSAGNVYAILPSGAVYKETYTAATNTFTEQLLFTAAGGSGIAVNAAGTSIYVGTGTAHTVAAYTGSGVGYTAGTSFGGFIGNTFPAVDTAGNVYIADAGTTSVYKETLSGSSYTQATIGTGFTAPSAIAVLPTGATVFVSSTTGNSITQLAGSGTTYTKATDIITGAVVNAQTGIAVDATGNLYIENNTSLLKAKLSSGTTYAATTLYGNTGATSLGIDTTGNLYIDAPGSANGTKLTPYANLGYVNFGSTVASAPVTQIVAFTALNAGTLGTATPVVTQGLTGLDYNSVTGGTCSGATLAVNGICTVQVSFSPQGSGEREGAASVTSNGVATAATALLGGIGKVPLALFNTGLVPQSLGTNYGLAIGFSVDAANNLYFADLVNNKILKIASGAASSTVLANTGTCNPGAVTLDGQGNIYYTCNTSNNIYELVGGTGSPVAIPVGTGTDDHLSIDASGNLYTTSYSPSGSNANVFYKIAAGTRAVSVIFTASPSSRYIGALTDPAGNVFALDSTNNALIEIPAGTFAATILYQGSPLNIPHSIAEDPAGNLYVENTSAGTAYRFAVGAYTSAPTSFPIVGSSAITIDSLGNFYTSSDTTVTKYSRNNVSLNFPSTIVGQASTSQTVVLENDGVAPLVFSLPTTGANPNVSSGFSFSPSSTCPVLTTSSSSTSTLAAGLTCTDVISFTPQVATATNAYTGSLTHTDNSSGTVGSIQVINLTGTGTIGTATVTVPNVSTGVGTTPTLTATIAGGGAAPGGTVTFKVGTGATVTATCTAGTGSAANTESCTAPYPAAASLAANTYPITAALTGDPNYSNASNTGTLTISSNPSPISNGGASVQSITISQGTTPTTLTVTIPYQGNAPPSGTVSFTVNGVAVPQASVSCPTVTASPLVCTASAATGSLATGTYAIVATQAAGGPYSAGSATGTLTVANGLAPVLNTGSSVQNVTITQGSTPTTLTATIVFTGTQPTGQVNFTVANGTLAPATCTLVSAGTLSCTASYATGTLTAGNSYTISAIESAGAGYPQGTATGTLTVITGGTPVSPLLNTGSSVSNIAIPYGTASTTLSATVVYPGTAPTGGFRFTVTGGSSNPQTATCVGTASPLTCTATYPTATLGVGSYTITAIEDASGSTYPAGQALATLTVTQAPASTNITVSGTGTAGAATTPVTVSIPYSGSVRPTGDINVTDGYGNHVTILASSCSANAGVLTCTGNLPTANEPSGNNSVTVTQAADSNYLAGTATGTVNIGSVATTTSVVSSANPSTFSQSVTFTATVAATTGSTVPAGAVQFSVDGSAVGGPVTLVSGQATFTTATLSVASHNIGAVYTPSSGAFTASTASTLVQVVNKIAATNTDTASGSSTYGATTPATVTVTIPYSGTTQPSGDVTVRDNSGNSVTIHASACTTLTGPTRLSCPVSFPTTGEPTGNNTLTISQAPDNNYAGSTGSGTLNVAAGPSSLSSNSAVVQSITITQTATPTTLTVTIPYTGTVAPTGTVSFTVNGVAVPAASVSCPTVTASPLVCTASAATGTLAVGNYPIVVTQGSDGNYTAGTASGTLTVGTGSVAPLLNTGSNVQDVTIVQGTATAPLQANIVYSGSATPPSGLVTFSIAGGTASTATCTSGSSPVSCTYAYPTASLAAGTYTITAVEAAGGGYPAGTSTATLTVTPAAGTPVSTLQNTGSSVSNISIPYGTATTTLSANVFYSGTAPTGAFKFTVTGGSGNPAPATCTPAAGGSPLTCTATNYPTATLAIGSYTITATEALTSGVYPAGVAYATLTVSQAPGTAGITVSGSGTSGAPTTQVTVSIPYTGATYPTGTVTVHDTSGNQITASPSSCTPSGTAPNSVLTCTVNLPTANEATGSNNITVTQAADANYSAGSGGGTINIVSTGSQTTLASSANPSTVGQSVTFTATVTATGGSGTPAGTVQFSIDGANVGSAVTVTGTHAAYTATGLAAGNHNVVATFTSTNGSFTGSTSTTLVQNVSQLSSTPVLTSSLNPSAYGVSSTLTATVATVSGVAPTGLVCFSDSTTGFIACAPLTSGVATISTDQFTLGANNLTATYQGDTNYAQTTSNTVVQNVTGTTATVAATNGLTSSVNPSATGTSTTLTGTVASTNGGAVPTGSESFYSVGTPTIVNLDATNANPAFQTLNLAAGTYSIAIVGTNGGTYAGWNPAAGASTNNLWSDRYGIALCATCNGLVNNIPSGTGYATAPAALAAFQATPTLSNTVSGGTNGQTVNNPYTFTLTSPQSVSLYVPDGSFTNGAYVASTTSFFDNSGGLSLSVTPLTFLGSGALNSSGVGTFPISTLPIGTTPIEAVYSGDGTYVPSTSNIVNQVVTVIAATNTDTVTGGAPYGSATAPITVRIPYSGTTQPTGLITVTDGTNQVQILASTCTASGGILTCTGNFPLNGVGAGSDPVTVSQAPDHNYAGSTGSGSVTVAQATGGLSNSSASVQNVTITQGTTSATLTATIPYTGATAPSGNVTFTVNGITTPTATCTSATAGSSPLTCTATLSPTTTFAVNSYTITANQVADRNYAAGSATGTLTVSNLPIAPLLNTGSKVLDVTIVQGSTPTTLTASIVYTGTAPTGLVTFNLPGGTAVTANCPATASPITCTYPYPTATLAVGSYTITANEAGDTNYAPGTSTATLTVIPTASTPNSPILNTGSNVPNVAITYGTANATLTATIFYNGTTPTGSVNFTVTGGSSNPTTATCSGVTSPLVCTATYPTSALAIGSYTITATEAATNGVYPAGLATGTLTVTRAASNNGIRATGSGTFGSATVPVTVTIPYTGTASPTGAITVRDSSGNQVVVPASSCTASGTAPNSVLTCTANLPASNEPIGTNPLTITQAPDSNYLGGTGAGSVTIAAAASQTALVSSSNPSTLGQNVTFTATVSPASGTGTPAGTVQFSIDGTNVGAPVTLVAGQASYTTNTIAPPGNHNVVATFTSTNGSFTGSTSTTLVQNVSQLSSTPVLTSSLNPSAYGVSSTLTATVATVSGVAPTGLVCFSDSTTGFITCASLVSGVATISTDQFTLGANNLTATYQGDTNYAQTTSNTVVQNVTGTTATVAATNGLTSSVNPSATGTSTTLTGTVASTNGGAVPTGSESFYSVGTPTIVNLDATNANPAFQTLNLAAGTYSIAIVGTNGGTYAGWNPAAGASTNNLWSDRYGIALCATCNGLVNNIPSGTGYATAPAALAAFQATPTLSNTVSGGTNGQTVNNPYTFTLTSPQSVSLYVPDGSFTNGAYVASTTSFFDNSGGLSLSVTPLTFLGSGALNSSGVGTFPISTLPIGTTPIEAVYSGDGTYVPSTSNIVNQVVTVIAATNTDTVTGGAPYGSATAPITVRIPYSGTTQPTGLITVTDGTNQVQILASTCTASGGILTCTGNFPLNGVGAGSDPVTVSQAPDHNYAGSTGSGSVTVAQATGGLSNSSASVQNVTITQGTTSATLTATIPYTGATAPSGNVTFTVNGITTPTATCTSATAGSSPLTCTATLSPTTTFAVNSYTITANQVADRNYAAGSATGTLTVSNLPIAPLLNTGSRVLDVTIVQGSTPTTLTASIVYTGTAPTGLVTFNLPGGTAVTANCPVTASPIICTYPYPTGSLAVGSYTITANEAGDTNYAPGTSTATLTVIPTASTPNSPILNTGSSVSNVAITYGTANATLTATIVYNGTTPTGAVNFTVAGGSGGTVPATCSGATSPLNCTATYPTATLPLGSYTITATEGGTTGVYPAGVATGTLTVTKAAATSNDTVSGSAPFGSATAPITVTIPYSGTTSPTGTITVTDGTNTVTIPAANCTASNGQLSCPANFPLNGVGAGSDPVTVTQAPDSNYAASTGRGTVTVGLSAGGLSSSSASVQNVTITQGTASATLTATIPYSGTVAPSGTVTFTVNGITTPAAVCTGTSSPLTCTATLSPTSGFAVNTYTITANQVADRNYAAGTATGTLTVTNGSANAPLLNTGSNVKDVTIVQGTTSATLSATLVYTGAVPTGAVNFTVAGGSGGTVTATCTGSSSPLTCTANYTPTGTLAVGSYTITATELAAGGYAQASSNATLTVIPTAATPNSPLLNTGSNVNNVSIGYGTPTTPLVAVIFYTGTTPTGPVSFTVAGGTGGSVPATCVGSSSPLTCTAPSYPTAALPVGSYTITATEQATSGVYPLGTATGTLTVTKAAVTGNDTVSGSAPYGSATAPITVNIPYSGTTSPTGTITVTDGTNTVTIPAANCTASNGILTCPANFPLNGLGAGSDPLTVTQAPDSNYAGSTGSGSVTITTATGGLSSASASVQNVTITQGTSSATLTATIPYTGAVAPSGNVTFTVNGITTPTAICTSAVAGSSPLTCTATLSPTTTFAVNSYTITANQVADRNYAAGSATGTLTVSNLPIAPLLNTGSKVLDVTIVQGSTPTTLTASIVYTGTAPTGLVTFNLPGGTAVTANCPVTASPITCTYPYQTGSLAVGSYMITVNEGGDANYAPGTSTATLTVIPTAATPNSPILNTGSSVSNVAITYGTANATLTATIVYSGTAPSGNVNFTVAGGSGGTVPAVCASTTSPLICTATYPTATLPLGSYTITATEAATTGVYPAGVASGTLTVTKAAATSNDSVSGSGVYGSPTAPITVTIPYSGSTAPTGTITVTDGTNTVTIPAANCTASNGQLSCPANFPISGVGAGSDPVTVTQAPDSNYAASTGRGTVTVALSAGGLSSASASVQNVTITQGTASTTLTATIPYSGSVAPTGTVTFTVNGITTPAAVCTGTSSPLICTATLSPTGSFAVNTYTITADQVADRNYSAGAATGTLTVTHGGANAPLLNTGSNVKDVTIVQGTTSATLSATLVYSGAAPTGAVNFTVAGGAGGTVTATCTGSSSPLTCTATYTPTAALAVGSYTITATELAAGGYAQASSNATLTVIPTANTPNSPLLNTGSNVNNVLIGYGTPTTPLVAVIYYTGTAPTGAVSLTVAGSTGGSVPATCVGTSSPLTCTAPSYPTAALPIGSYTITATEQATPGVYPLGTATGTLTVTKAATTSGDTVSGTAPYGSATAPITVNIPYSGTTPPTGIITVTDGTNTVTILASSCTASNGVLTCTGNFPLNGVGAGSDPVTVSQAPDSNYAGSSGSGSVIVTPSTGGLSSASASVQNVTITQGTASTTLTATIPYTGAVAPGGAVTFTVNGITTPAAVCTASPTGSPLTCTATLSPTTTFAVNSYTITANQVADRNYAAGSATGTLTVSNLPIAPLLNTGSRVLDVTIVQGSTPTTLTASIVYTGTAPTGLVTFNLPGGTAVTANCPVTASPIICTYPYPTGSLAVGSYTITANEAGDTNYAPGTSTATLTVIPTASTPNSPILNTGSSVSNVAITYGTANATLTATIVYNGTTPTGAVNFTVAGGSGGTVPATCSGATSPLNCTATYPTATLPLGSYTITATEGGTTGVYPAGVATGTLTVTKAANTGINATGSGTYGNPTTPVTVTIPYSGATPPTGAVTVTDANGNQVTVPATICTAAGGVLTCVVNLPTAGVLAGTDPLTITQAPDSNYRTGTGTGVVTIAPAAGSLSSSSAAVQNLTIAQGTASVTLTATIPYTGVLAPSGSVTFVVGNGTSVQAVCAGTSSPLTCTATYSTGSLALGNYPIVVSQAADRNYAAGTTSGTLTVTNNALPALLNTGSQVKDVTIVQGATPTTLTASIVFSGTAPTGQVTFNLPGGTAVIATCQITASPILCTASYPTGSLALGSYTITATEAGDTNYGQGSSNATLTVIPAAATPNSPILNTGSSVTNVAITYGTASATLTSTIVYSGTAPTGNVNFTVAGGSGGTVLAACPVTASPILCTATYPTATLPLGSYTITATEGATTGVYPAGMATGTLTVTRTLDAIVFPSLPSTPFNITPPVPAATSTSGQPVTYSTTSAACSVTTSGVITFNSIGSCAITASQAAAGNYAAAAPVTQSFTITPAPNAINIPTGLPTTGTVGGTPISIGATSLSGGPITYVSATPTVCSVTTPGGVVTILTPGVCTINLSQPAAGNFAAAPPRTVTFNALDFTIVANTPTSQTVIPGGLVVYTYSLAPLGGQYPGANVTYTVTGLPPGATYTLTPLSGTVTQNGGPQTLVLTITTAQAVAMNHLRSNSTWALVLLLPLLMRRKLRKKVAQSLAMLVLLAIAAGVVTGCGDPHGFFGQPVGNYSITVTATSGTVTHSANPVTLQLQ